MKIFIEPGEETKTRKCIDCGRLMIMLNGFINEDNQPLAVYFATLYPKEHLDRRVGLTIVIGEWGSNGEWSNTGDWKNNTSINLEIRPTKKQFRMFIVDRKISESNNSKLLGTMLSRKKTLEHPLKEKFFHLADHIVEDDSRINNYLVGT